MSLLGVERAQEQSQERRRGANRSLRDWHSITAPPTLPKTISIHDGDRQVSRRTILREHTDMHDILAMGARAGELLKARGEKIVVGETSAGGLISASLLAVPGASAYFTGGAITYSYKSIRGLAGISTDEMRAKGIRSSSEPYAELLARAVLAKHEGVTWGLSETGAAGPSGNPYGDPPGHTCMAVVGPLNLTRTLRTGLDDRVANMWRFAEATLALLVEALEAAPRA